MSPGQASMLTVVSWQPTLTEHQVHLLRALAAQEGVRLKVVVGRRELDHIARLGWRTPDYADLDVTVIGPQAMLRRGARALREERDATHVFSAGLWTDRRFFLLLLLAVAWGRRVAMVTEPYSDAPESYYSTAPGRSDRLKALLRPLAYRTAGMALGRSISPVFAISPKAEAQMRKAGFSRDTIFPFGYFVPADEEDLTRHCERRRACRVAARGVRRKPDSPQGGGHGCRGDRRGAQHGSGRVVGRVRPWRRVAVPERPHAGGAVLRRHRVRDDPAGAARLRRAGGAEPIRRLGRGGERSAPAGDARHRESGCRRVGAGRVQWCRGGVRRWGLRRRSLRFSSSSRATTPNSPGGARPHAPSPERSRRRRRPPTCATAFSGEVRRRAAASALAGQMSARVVGDIVSCVSG